MRTIIEIANYNNETILFYKNHQILHSKVSEYLRTYNAAATLEKII